MLRKRTISVIIVIFMAFAAGCSGRNGNGANSGVINIPTNAPITINTPEATQHNTDEPVTTTLAPVDLTPAPTEVPTLPEGQALWLNTMPTELYGLTTQEAEAWFSDAVFIGDSIMLGWKNYLDSMIAATPSFFGAPRVLCEGSYGAGHALEPVSETSLHPIYGGAQHQIWDSIALMGAKKVFICFGLNDIAVYGVDDTVSNFNAICNNILEKTPDASIYIISAMYMYQGSEMTRLNNTNLRLLNDGLRSLCKQNGYKFIDIASHLVNEAGYVLDEYSSDKYVHQTAAAYGVWAEVLRSVAAHNIKWGY